MTLWQQPHMTLCSILSIWTPGELSYGINEILNLYLRITICSCSSSEMGGPIGNNTTLWHSVTGQVDFLRSVGWRSGQERERWQCLGATFTELGSYMLTSTLLGPHPSGILALQLLEPWSSVQIWEFNTSQSHRAGNWHSRARYSGA